MEACPRCGRTGKRGVKRVVSKGKVYWYEIYRHADGSTCVIRRLSEDEVEALRPSRSRLEYELRAAKYLLGVLLEELWWRRELLRIIGEEVERTLHLFRWYNSQVERVVEALVGDKDLSEREERVSEHGKVCSRDN